MNDGRAHPFSKFTSWKILIDTYWKRGGLTSRKLNQSCHSVSAIYYSHLGINLSMSCHVHVVYAIFSHITVVWSKHSWIWRWADWSTSTQLLSSSHCIKRDDTRNELRTAPNVNYTIWVNLAYFSISCRYSLTIFTVNTKKSWYTITRVAIWLQVTGSSILTRITPTIIGWNKGGQTSISFITFIRKKKSSFYNTQHINPRMQGFSGCSATPIADKMLALTAKPLIYSTPWILFFLEQWDIYFLTPTS